MVKACWNDVWSSAGLAGSFRLVVQPLAADADAALPGGGGCGVPDLPVSVQRAGLCDPVWAGSAAAESAGGKGLRAGECASSAPDQLVLRAPVVVVMGH
ncbi:MAG: hypothetical protein MJZ57_09355, partial [Bacteroidales bacterium]|nr:hypothetical protein [Bacteroidales bacterium]